MEIESLEKTSWMISRIIRRETKLVCDGYYRLVYFALSEILQITVYQNVVKIKPDCTYMQEGFI